MFKRNLLALFSATLLCNISMAATSGNHVIVAPNCLINKLDARASLHTLAKSKTLTLVETNTAGVDYFIAAKQISSKTPCGGFIDVTDEWQSKKIAPPNAYQFLQKYEKGVAPQKNNYSINYPTQVNTLLKQLNPTLMWQDLSIFSNTQTTNFPDRYPNSVYGLRAVEWLKNKVLQMAKDNNRTDIKIWTVQTGDFYDQPSLVVKLGNSNESGIVIGGHMDTLSGQYSVKPGADDDGSGSMTVMSVARTILGSGMTFKKPIYFVWYAAEEQGLVGSGYVVKDFVNRRIPVSAVLQFDMTGYSYANDRTMWLVTDYVNPDLTNFLETLIKTYVKQPVGRTRCGYGCSDHASWYYGKFNASFPFESSFNNHNPYIHSSRDTMNYLSLVHATDFAKLGIAFAVELAQPTA